MKTVVVEIKDDLAIILSDDGRITSLKNKNYAIGQVIMMKDTTAKKKYKKCTWVAAAAVAMFLLLGGGTYAYYTPYSYVSLDVNPSLEYILNRFDRVLEVRAVNDDGEEILKEIQLDSLENENIKVAIYETVEQIQEVGYFNGEEEGGIVIATSSEDQKDSEELANDLQESVENATEDEDIDVVIETISVGEERVAEARELGVTPGKLNLVQKLQASAINSEDIDIEEWLTKSVKEIMKETKANRQAQKAQLEDESESEVEIDEDDIDETLASEEIEEKESNAVVKQVEKELKVEEKLVEKESKAEEKLAEKELKAEEKLVEKESKAEEKLVEKESKSEEKSEKSNNNGNSSKGN